MRVSRICITAVSLLLLFSVPCYGATASASDAGRDGAGSGTVPALPLDEEEVQEEELSYEEYLEEEGFYDDVSSSALSGIQSDVSEILDLLASGSEADRVQVEENSLDDPEEYSILSDVRAVNGLPDHDVFAVSGTFSGDNYTIIFPASYRQYIWIGDDNVLYNIGPESITGRAFPNGQFDSSSYNYRLFTFRSMLQNNANMIYNNHYLSSMQYYYESSYDRLTSSTIYGNFIVDDDGVTEYRSYAVDYKSYYALVVILFMIGGVWLCYWKSSRH